LATLKDLTRQIQRAPGFPEVVAALKNGRSATIDGAWGSASALAAAALGLHAPTTLVIAIAHVGDVDDFRDDVATFAGAVPEIFPAWEKPPRELTADDEIFGKRLRVLKRLGGPEPPRLVVAPFQAMLQPVPKPDALKGMSRIVAVGDTVPVEELMRWLLDRGMTRSEVVEVPGEFSVRGGILDVFPTDASDPVRIEFFGDEVERRRRVDPALRRRVAAVARPMELGQPDRRPGSR
jgi:transcription-repair coupling factor (superfamily II helicase)